MKNAVECFAVRTAVMAQESALAKAAQGLCAITAMSNVSTANTVFALPKSAQVPSSKFANSVTVRAVSNVSTARGTKKYKHARVVALLIVIIARWGRTKRNY